MLSQDPDFFVDRQTAGQTDRRTGGQTGGGQIYNTLLYEHW